MDAATSAPTQSAFPPGPPEDVEPEAAAPAQPLSLHEDADSEEPEDHLSCCVCQQILNDPTDGVVVRRATGKNKRARRQAKSVLHSVPDRQRCADEHFRPQVRSHQQPHCKATKPPHTHKHWQLAHPRCTTAASPATLSAPSSTA